MTFENIIQSKNSFCSQSLAISYASVYVHSCAPAVIIWSSTESRQALKYGARETIPCCGHSKTIDSPVLIFSEKDRALALAIRATQWRKQQLNNIQKANPKESRQFDTKHNTNACESYEIRGKGLECRNSKRPGDHRENNNVTSIFQIETLKQIDNNVKEINHFKGEIESHRYVREQRPCVNSPIPGTVQ